MSGNQNHHSPLCNSVHLGTNRKHAAKTLSFFCGKVRIANLVVPEEPCSLPWKTEQGCFPTKVFQLGDCATQLSNCTCAKKGNEMREVPQALSKSVPSSVPQALSISVPSSVPDLQETAPQPPCLANAKMTKERGKITSLPTCFGSQMTNEDIREYANLTIHVCETRRESTRGDANGSDISC